MQKIPAAASYGLKHCIDAEVFGGFSTERLNKFVSFTFKLQGSFYGST